MEVLILGFLTSLGVWFGFFICKKTKSEVVNGLKFLKISGGLSFLIWFVIIFFDSFNALIFLFFSSLVLGSVSKRLFLSQFFIFLFATISLFLF